MYCPNCAAEVSGDQRFCRSCGVNLQAVSQIPTGPIMSSPPDESVVQIINRFQSRREKMKRWGFAVFWGGILVAAFFGIVGSALEEIAGDVGSFIAQLSGLGGLVLLIGIGMMIYSRFLPKVDSSVFSRQSTGQLRGQPTTNLPPQRRRPNIPSVTEQTTELLDAQGPHTPAREMRREGN